ncbi:MAG: precorrin-6A/cobalt-precorrin-6A reductase, partial [Rhodobacterales bacterium]|nr:precorrin-6A/cobalt-precorrin-6A reductase [Rhodobacterales bacterium]
THPFAAVMPARARAACDALGLPRLVLRRPPWTPEPGDDWTEAADAAAAARLLAARPAARRILLTTGLTDLQAFAALADRTLVVRLIRPPDGPLPLPNAHVVTGRPHADAAAEGALMAAHGIDTLVTKNSGGAAGFGKIAAARARGAAMVVLARPPVEPGPAMETVGTAVAWLSANVA